MKCVIEEYLRETKKMCVGSWHQRYLEEILEDGDSMLWGTLLYTVGEDVRGQYVMNMIIYGLTQKGESQF